MNAIKLDATKRQPGKGPAHAARRAELVPCILYGRGEEPVPFQVAEKSLHGLIYTSEFHRVEVSLGKKSWDAILKNVDYHPTSDRPMHADFQMLKAGEVVTLSVPIQYHGISLGQRNGGRMEAFAHELEITCLPKDIPEHIEIDVTDLDIGDSIHVGDLTVEKVTISESKDTTLYAVMAARVEEVVEVDEELEIGEDGEGEGEEGEGEGEEREDQG